MTNSDWWAIGKFALVCGVAGPLMGVILLWWFPLAIISIINGSLEDLTLITGVGLTNAALVLLSSGLPAFLLGALGTWLLIRMRKRRHGPRGLRLAAIGYGATAGMAVALLAHAQGAPYSAGLGGLPTVLLGVAQIDAKWHGSVYFASDIVAGGVVGTLLGLFVDWRARTTQPGS